ncbi:MAG: cytochrome c, 20 heme-binding site [Clostridia bacterium]|jgi:hypothetical protein|nr:cytochrome c, 20 heme-binding site [Clostridia bacterium]
MKKILITFTMFMATLIASNVYSASSISVSRSSVTTGDTFTVTATVSGVAAWGMFITPSGPVTYVSGSTSSADATADARNGSNTITATYKANSVGTATFTLSGDTTDENGNNVNISGSRTVTVNAPVVNNPTTPTTPTNTTKSNNANLKKLVPSYEGLSPNFNPAVTKYSLAVPATATSLGLTVAVEQTGAKYWINGEDNLQMGDNTVNITVTAPDGTKKVYTIIVTKVADVKKANAYLSNIVIDGKTLNPAFTAENLEYDIGAITSDISKLTVLAYAQSENAKVEVIGSDALVEGANVIKIKVTAPDGVTTKEYTIKYNKEAAAKVDEEVIIYPEANSLQGSTPSKLSNFFKALWIYIKNFWLVLSLLTVCLFELWQIIYLYKKVEKVKKNDHEENDVSTLGEKTSRRRNADIANVFGAKEEKIEDISDELVSEEKVEKKDEEDISDNFEDAKDIEEDK